MDSTPPVPLLPIRSRTRSVSISSDEDSFEPPGRSPGHQSFDAEEGHDPLLSRSEQDAIARNSRHSPSPSSSGGTTIAQSGPTLLTKNEIRHALPGLVSCAISWILIASFYALVWLHKDRVISPHTKSTFDAAVVGLGIVFGLNVASGFKRIALDLRWWILNSRKRSGREVESIIRCDSLTELARLMFVTRETKIRFICGCWLSLNILVQTAIATLSLTLSGDPGPADIYRTTGLSDMAVANISRFAPYPSRFYNREFVERLAAHILGDIGSSYNYTTLPEIALSGTPWAENPAMFWNATDHWEYVFRDSAVLDPTSAEENVPLRAVSIYTDDVATASGSCRTPTFWVNETDRLLVINVNSTGEVVYFPASLLESVLYLTTPVLATPNAECGPGCGTVKVLEQPAGPPVPGSTTSSYGYYYYDCNITVSAPEYLSTTNAAVAAQAIALSGERHPEIFTLGPETSEWGSYTYGMPFGEPQNNSAVAMASLLSRFAIGVVAAAAETNPKAIIQGHAPAQGVRIQLRNPVLFSLILVAIGLIQSCLFVVAVRFGSRLEIPVVAISQQDEIRKHFVVEPATS
ncbi:hypothetical protein ACET3X_004558 [Alternaria dauci]|uniref:Uncharacterized protein n=1 Tax=Alternaria dauci TaxID=48095 RepID=A0ABR3UNW3_9PLEO